MASTARSLSIYLHVPFCSTKCTYCAFNTYIHLDHLIEPFVEALIAEIRLVGAGASRYRVETVFFGGGTPSLLTLTQFERIVEALRASFGIADDAEWSLEANPSDLNRDYLAALHYLGFNRLSIGMQSAHANELALFNRRHDNDAVSHAFFAARSAGFNSINLDLIYGFPHQTLESWRLTLEQALLLQPDHVSLYALGLEEGTPMHAWVERGRLPMPDDDLTADMYELASDMLAGAGLVQYEISNWAKTGHQCRHNLQYWFNGEYLGLGPGAHGFAAGVRYVVLRSPQRYIARLRENEEREWTFPVTPAVETAVSVDRSTEIAETLIMSLRLTEHGVDRAAFSQRFGVDLLELHGDVIRRHEAMGLLLVDDERVRISRRGRLLSNLVFRDLV